MAPAKKREDRIAYGPDRAMLAGATRAAFDRLDLLDLRMSHYRADSELSAINRMAGREPVRVSGQLFDLLARCFRYSRDTGGAFDITIGPLIKAWGFFQHWGRVPSTAELENLLGDVGYHHVSLDEAVRSIQFDSPRIELNLGAVGKGLAVDRMATILRAAGVTRALVASGTSRLSTWKAWMEHCPAPPDG